MAGAPIGNQNAKGSTTNGAPEKYDLEKEAQDLLDWSKKDNSFSLYDFTDPKDYAAKDLSYFASRSIVFSDALKKAKERISRRREVGVHSGTIDRTVWGRTARIYDHLLVESEEWEKDQEIERRKRLIDYELDKKDQLEKNRGVPPNDQPLDAIIDQLKQLKDKK